MLANGNCLPTEKPPLRMTCVTPQCPCQQRQTFSARTWEAATLATIDHLEYVHHLQRETH